MNERNKSEEAIQDNIKAIQRAQDIRGY